MAWPCISRVCCLARFWDQFDKSDLSVPLTIQNYSDITEHEVRSVTKQVSASEHARPNDYSSPPRATGSAAVRVDARAPRGSFRTRGEQNYNPREDYRSSSVPFSSITQYKQDYKPWPIPKKDNFPWINNEARDTPLRGNREKVHGQHQGSEPSPTSSYRHEFKPWTGVKPAESTKKNFPIHCATPGTEASHVAAETSYQAAYSGENHRSAGLSHGRATPSTVHTVPVPRAQTHNCYTELPEAEENVVRTKLPPNPAAIFQSGSGVFNM